MPQPYIPTDPTEIQKIKSAMGQLIQEIKPTDPADFAISRIKDFAISHDLDPLILLQAFFVTYTPDPWSIGKP